MSATEAGAPPAIVVETLGPLSVLSDGQEIPGFRGKPKLLALLVFLSVERSAPREKLMALFWPESPPPRARASLNTAVHGLRQMLGSDAIRTDPHRVGVSAEVTADVALFESAAVEHVDAALSLYRGPFLEGLVLDEGHDFEAWVSGQERRLRDLHSTVLGGNVQALEREGRLVEAVLVARGWVQRYAFEESAQAALITLLLRTGRPKEADDQRERYDELMLEHGLEVSERFRRTIEDAAGATAPAGPPVGEETERLHGEGRPGPRLVRVTGDPDYTETFPLAPGRNTIGRAAECTLSFQGDALLSPFHASLTVHLPPDGDGAIRCVIRDEGSAGGVYLRVAGSRVLQHRDMVGIGRQVLRFDLD